MSAFERHFAGVTGGCLDPAARGLVAVTRHASGRDWQLWGWPPAQDPAGRFRETKIPAEQTAARMAGTPGTPGAPQFTDAAVSR
ncbi:MAG: hypothetical protein ACRDOK_01550 [Streptosporangiaceae bacterium]